MKKNSFISESGNIDTLILSKLLKQAKFSDEQSELVAEIIKTSTSKLATRKALKEKQNDNATKSDIKELELKIEKAKSNILMWMGGLLIAQAGLIVTLIKIL